MNTLTVGIVSYNRPRQLLRCIESLFPLPAGVKVVISDDCSPKLNEIREVIYPLVSSNDNVRFHVNERNVGYDENLLNVIKISKTSHVLLLGDDDMLEEGCLPSVMEHLREGSPKAAFLRYRLTDALIKERGINRIDYYRDFKSTSKFDCDELLSSGAYIYNAILFSGLLFDRREVLAVSVELDRFKKSIYMQVAIFALLSRGHGGWFIGGPGVMTGSDGENGFGLNEASGGDHDLVDRTTVLSKLKYNRRLIKVVDDLGGIVGPKFIDVFFREYNFRNVSGMLEARVFGRATLREYWLELSSITRGQNYFHFIMYYFLLILPVSASGAILRQAERLVRGLRQR